MAKVEKNIAGETSRRCFKHAKYVFSKQFRPRECKELRDDVEMGNVVVEKKKKNVPKRTVGIIDTL